MAGKPARQLIRGSSQQGLSERRGKVFGIEKQQERAQHELPEGLGSFWQKVCSWGRALQA